MRISCTIWLPDENYPEAPFLLEPGELVSDLQDKLEARVEKKAKLALDLQLLKPSSDLLMEPLDTLAERIEASLTTAVRLVPSKRVVELGSNWETHVQVIAVRAVFRGKTKPKETAESDAVLDETVRYKESSPSDAAKSSHYRKHQADSRRAILDGRPAHNNGPPIALYHQVFSEFQEDMTKKLTKEDLTTSERVRLENFIVTASELYATEDSRRAAMLPSIRKMGIAVETPKELSFSLEDCKASCDALIRSFMAILLLAEIKNLTGTGGSDPAIQGGLSYQTYWADKSARPMMNVCCCPSFVLAIAGEKICIFGAVLVEKVIVQPLTPTMWMGCDANVTATVLELACMFRALKAGLDKLRAFYAQLTPLATRAASRYHPCIRTFPQTSADGTANTVELEYERRLALDHRSTALFEAQCEGKRVVVKFPRTYCPEAHRLLAQHGYAPELVYAAEETRVPDRWMVVMGFVKGKTTYDLYRDGPLPAAVVAEVRNAIAILHEAGWVFADLRPPNIMVLEAASGPQVQFIDFDWCGKESDEKYLYPAALNKAITWAPDVFSGTVLKKAHDLHMINELMTTRPTVRRNQSTLATVEE